MKYLIGFLLFSLWLFSCEPKSKMEQKTTTEMETKDNKTNSTEFEWQVDRFADIRVLRYKLNSLEKLSLKQKKLVYYLTEAGYSGRDIQYDMNYRHNLKIRRSFEKIYANYKGDRTNDNWNSFVVYLKRIWFANGIHHHYSMDKFTPDFDRIYLAGLLTSVQSELSDEIMEVIFNPDIDNKKVNLDTKKDLVYGSAINFYDPDIKTIEVETFYSKMSESTDTEPISHGLNSKVIRDKSGNLMEKVWKVDGMYGKSIQQIIMWLELAKGVAENEQQARAFDLLIKYYQTGDLKIWDEYNMAWVATNKGDIDYINSFIEVYNDPMGYKGSYENIIEINDFEASERMQVLSENAQWFEDNSTIKEEHKKPNVVGVSYKVVETAGESGDASPATPIGVNLPNADWIRAKHGSKSVSLGNIIGAYDQAKGGKLMDEVYRLDEIKARVKKHGSLAGKMATALHEVIGHASGKINHGIGTPKETLKSYASTLEEARADIVALYFIMDPKMIELGLVPNNDVALAEYDSYISNGMMWQLQRLEKGKVIEESHMRNRQLICAWAYEKGKKDNIIEKIVDNGKTYFEVRDYAKLRNIFGELLMIIQKIKSEGDFEAGSKLVEDYGVQVDPTIHAEVLARIAPLNIPPYSGFVNPILTPEKNKEGEITDIKVTYAKSFEGQMMNYAKNYSFLPDYN